MNSTAEQRSRASLHWLRQLNSSLSAAVAPVSRPCGWQRARYREGRHLFAPADPVMVGQDTLQRWFGSRIGVPSDHAALSNP